MCGIGVWFTRANKWPINLFGDFMSVISHRGPDAQIQVEVEPGLFFGNNRLAIIDNNARSNQPFIYQHFTIIFNGAIYNFQEIKKDLLNKGHQFNTESDTEVIVHAFEEYGDKCVELFDGMWAFVIHDSIKKTLFVSRDRFGIKPLYYSCNSDQLFIGSEIKQFRIIPEFELNIRSKSVQYYLESGGFKNHDANTFYEDVFQLEPGCSMLYRLEDFSLEKRRYYDLKETTKSDHANVAELINDSVLKRTISDFTPSVMFSGGLDSSIILGHLLQHNPHTKSYSFIEDRDELLNEGEYISAFLNQYKHENHQVSLPEKIDTLISDCLVAQDEPPASLSAVAQFLIYSLASRNGEKLMMSGQGADELFAGYPRNLSLLSKGSFFKSPIRTIDFIKDNSTLLFRHFTSNKENVPFSNPLMPQSNFSTIKDYMYYLINSNGLRDLLHYEDRNSMAHGIETRVPFLSHELVEFAYHLEDKKKLSRLKRKGILLDSYRKVLPPKIYKRKNKLAFDTPEKYLLKQGVFSVEKELLKVKEKFPKIEWNDNYIPSADSDVMFAWQLRFLNEMSN